jgi:signal recognition particle receptor subunit beta
MAIFNYSAKEITLKVVYYGPGFSGKTTNLQQLHTILPSDTRGKLISLATEADRTLFFDFLPVDFGKIKDFKVRFQLYTVPGQIKYDATRRLVLKGADAVVFVADSQREVKEQNCESFKNLKQNLVSNNLDPDDIPIILQYNKRDIANIMSVDEMNRDLNNHEGPFFQAVATEGKGVQETFKDSIAILVKRILKKYKIDISKPSPEISPSDSEKVPPEVITPAPRSSPSTFASSRASQRQSARPVALKETVTKVETQETNKQQMIPSHDPAELVSVIGELKAVLVGIKDALRDMQKNQERTLKEVSEMRRIFSTAKMKKGLRRLFQ